MSLVEYYNNLAQFPDDDLENIDEFTWKYAIQNNIPFKVNSRDHNGLTLDEAVCDLLCDFIETESILTIQPSYMNIITDLSSIHQFDLLFISKICNEIENYNKCGEELMNLFHYDYNTVNFDTYMKDWCNNITYSSLILPKVFERLITKENKLEYLHLLFIRNLPIPTHYDFSGNNNSYLNLFYVTKILETKRDDFHNLINKFELINAPDVHYSVSYLYLRIKSNKITEDIMNYWKTNHYNIDWKTLLIITDRISDDYNIKPENITKEDIKLYRSTFPCRTLPNVILAALPEDEEEYSDILEHHYAQTGAKPARLCSCKFTGKNDYYYDEEAKKVLCQNCVKNKEKDKLIYMEPICQICRDELIGKPFVILACKHIMCKQCYFEIGKCQFPH